MNSAIASVQEFNRLFMKVVQAAIEQTPESWQNGTVVIHKRGTSVNCEFFNPDSREAIAVTKHLRTRCLAFSRFQRTDNFANDWSQVAIHFTFEDPSVDYTATREFTYPDRPEPANLSLPDASFWRKETANNAWQQSPSLCVIEFLLDCGEWQTSTMPHSQPWQAGLHQIHHKFFHDSNTEDLIAHLETYQHKISAESVSSAETINTQATVMTLLRENGQETEQFFEYKLVWHEGRWFIDRLYLKDSKH